MGEGYVIGTALGEGLVGPRLAGRYRPTGHAVALEEVPASLLSRSGFVERLAAAGRQAASVATPHVVEVYDLVRLDGRLFVVSELCQGRSLAALLGGEAPLPLPAALGVTDSVLAALEEIHAAGLVHGDVCPDTVIVTRSGDVRLGELGLASVLAAEPALREWPAVQPPEGGVPSVAADLFGAGALLRELATGLRPEQSGQWAGPVAVGSLVARAVAPDPAQRPASATLFREELQRTAAAELGEGWRERSDLAARATGPPGPAPPRPRRLPRSPMRAQPAAPPPPPAATGATATPPARPAAGAVPAAAPPAAGGEPPRSAPRAVPTAGPPAVRGETDWSGVRGLGRERPSTPPAWAPPRRRHRRRIAAAVGALVVAAAIVVAVLATLKPFPATPSGPAALSVGTPVLTAQPAGAGGCGTTFTFTATGPLHGDGTLTFRWLVAETGSPTTFEQYSLRIGGQSSFRFTKQLSFSGAASIGMTITFEVLSPQQRTATVTRRYVCTG